ncbi:MAG: hypothetical protein KC657_40100, partial [Myxococcales bacterium]|nr:hypothetical protein [Myxococcales bacterium]
MTDELRARFEAHARGIRRAFLARAALTGATLGALAAAPVLTFVDATPRAWLAPLGVAAALIGAAASGAWARRRRWTDADVAVFLDAKLASREAIATAIALPAGARGAAG